MKTMMKKLTVLTLAGLFLTVSLGLGGCAQDLGEIDRTQLDILHKQDLEGEWYMRHTTVDAPFASFFTFVGDQSKMERGHFEVTEGYVVFYRTYEFTENTQTIGLKSDTDKPLLVWLDGDASMWTPNPYLATDKKFAAGKPLEGLDGSATLACDGKEGKDGGGMHDFCRANTGNGYAYCGHEVAMSMSERTHANALCVQPTRYVYTGAPLAAYPIEDHLDVIYSYNPTTGEKTNVIKEDTADRFWYERDFIRVDWGTNDIVNYQYTLFSVIQGQFKDMDVSQEVSITNFEGDAGPEEDQFRIFRSEDGVPEYFDFTTRYIMSAPKAYYEYWGSEIPICIYYPFYLGGVFECSAEEVKSRSSFMKVDREDDYRPWQYDDHLMDKFGYFRQERQVYDELYYVTYPGVQRYIQRWDIWDTHPINADGTPDYSSRTPVPIVYYLSEDFPRELVPAANELAQQWSVPFNEIVAETKGVDAVPGSGMFLLCENNNSEAQAALAQGLPVAAYDNPMCKDMDYVKFNGDLRYSFMFSVNAPAENGLLGYGPSAGDPLSGKIISASAYIYKGNLELAINRAADLVQHMVGFLDYPTFVSGLDLSAGAYPEQLQVSGNPPPSSIADAQGLARTLLNPMVRERISKFGFEKSDADWAHMRMSMIKEDPELDRAMITDDIRVLMRDPAFFEGAPLTDHEYEEMALRNWANHRGYEKRRDQWLEYAKHTLYRIEFADGAMIALAKGWQHRYDAEICGAVAETVAGGEELGFDMSDFNIVKDACTLEQAGTQRQSDDAPVIYMLKNEYDPTRPQPGDTCMWIDQGGFEGGYYWVNTCTVQKLAAQITHALEFSENMDQLDYWKPSAWWANTKDPVIAKSQQVVRDIGTSLREEMLAEFRHNYWLSVALHEVGHTVGLRHNFEGSTDALNFPKKYWDYKVAPANGSGYVPVDLWGREKSFQAEAGMRELQYASIMDYGSKINGMWQGLGLYDMAAIKFGYAGLVEVFENAPKMKDYEKYLQDPQNKFGQGETAPVRTDPNRMERLFKRIHYTQIPNVLGNVENIYARKNVPLTDVRGDKCGSDADCGGGKECREQEGGTFCAKADLVEVPYRFCSDEYAGRTAYCDVWDEGADPYEIVRNTVDDYWWYWPVWGRWRGKVTFHSDNYSARVLYAFYRMKKQFQWWAVDNMRFNRENWWAENVSADNIPWDEDLNGGLSGSMATAEAFNTLINVFAIPSSSGSTVYHQVYGYNQKTDRYEPSTNYNYNDMQRRFVLEEDYGKFAGRPMYGGYQFGADDINYTSGGAIYDRLNAFIALTDPRVDFLSIEEYSDARKYLISFFTFFPEKMISVLGGLTTQRYSNYASCVVEDNAGNPTYLRLRDVRNADDPDFCKDGHYLYPEETDYDFVTTWYRIPMLAAYFGMALMINNYDRRFMDATRIFIKGHGDEITLPVDAEVIEFLDPMTGKNYMAYKAGEDNVTDIAWYLVNRCATVASGMLVQYNIEFTKMLEKEEVTEDQRSAWLKEQFQNEYAEGVGELQRMVALLELLRGMHKVYDYSSYGSMAFDLDP